MAKLFRVPVTVTYKEEVEVWAKDEAEARRLVTEEGYADGADYVNDVVRDDEPEITVTGDVEELEDDGIED